MPGPGRGAVGAMHNPAMHVATLMPLSCALSLALALSGCATRSADVKAELADAASYASWNCERLAVEADTVQQRAADVAYAVDARVGNNMIALGVGVMVFWPALLAMRPDGMEAQELAQLKGRYEAMRVASTRRACGEPSRTMSAQMAAVMPVAVGERLVYEDRPGGAASARELGLRVTALRRDQIEFRVDLADKVSPDIWRQDLAGNTLSGTSGWVVGWGSLLRRNMDLGQVVAGDLTSPDATQSAAKVRGQVVAVGPQLLAGRRFDVAVIELFGDAPGAQQGSVRLDGVMAVDRNSGVLLRLELRCTNPEFAVRRRLLRVES